MSSETTGREPSTAERMVFFSDAVVAIAMTLLAIDLPIPDGHTANAFWSSVRHNESEYLAFLISFAVIAAAWAQHHRAFQYAERSDAAIRGLNMVWLLTIVLNPFATKVLTTQTGGTRTTHAVQYGFYALLQVVGSVVLLAIVRRLESRGYLRPGAPRLSTDEAWRPDGVLWGFGLSIPLFFLSRRAWVLWFVVPVIFGQVRRRRKRRAHRTASSRE